MKHDEIRTEIKSLLLETNSGDAENTDAITQRIADIVVANGLERRLKLLYDCEKNYLELIKEYKEEIKFAATLQEDLRKERAKFFAEALREVSETLRDAQVESEVASSWIEELVASYTRSLDLSSDLAKDRTLDTIGLIRARTKSELASPSGEVAEDKSP